MRRPFLASLAATTLAACGVSTPDATTVAEVERVLNDYREGWMARDSARVLRHLSEDVTVSGSNDSTVRGKDRLRYFWFPGGDTTYPIYGYLVTDQTLRGGGKFVTAQGIAMVTWDMVVRDSLVSRTVSQGDYQTVLRLEDGHWRIWRHTGAMR